MRITEKDTKFFINLSNDKNKIHFDKKYAKKFFFKEPIAHGINIINFALAEFIKTKNYKLIIQNLSINLKNFLVIGEDFELKIYKKKIIVKNQLNIKIEIDVEYLKTSKKVQKEIRTKKTSVLQYYKIKNLYNYSLMDELIFISYYVGSIKPGCGSLIHRININYSNKNNKKFSLIVNKKLNNIFNISYCNNFFKCEIITSKLKPFKVDQDECRLSSRALKNIIKKKILIFGSSSDIAKRLINKRFITKCKIFKHSFRIDFNNPITNKIDLLKLKQKIYKIKPDFIFYLSSPRIYNGKRNNLKLLKYYNYLFVDYFEKILDIVRNQNYKTRIFYPSTIYLNNKNYYKRLECYLLAKDKAEKICKLKQNKKIVSFFRIPQLISRSNYNMFGFYEGKNLSVLDKYFNKFFEKS